jgi:hypothetical protein
VSNVASANSKYSRLTATPPAPRIPALRQLPLTSLARCGMEIAAGGSPCTSCADIPPLRGPPAQPRAIDCCMSSLQVGPT